MRVVLYRHKLALPTFGRKKRIPAFNLQVVDSNCKRRKLRALIHSKPEKMMVENLSHVGLSRDEIITNITRISEAGITLQIIHPSSIVIAPNSRGARILIQIFKTEREVTQRKKLIADLVSSLVSGQDLGRPAKALSLISKIREMRTEGISLRGIGTALNLSAATIHRALRLPR